MGVLILTGFVIYEFFLDASTKEKVDVAYYAGLNKIGLVSKEGLDKIRQNLRVATSKLEKTNEKNQQLNQMVEQMIHNNEVTENLKHILKKIYGDPKTKYISNQKHLIHWKKTQKKSGKNIKRWHWHNMGG